MHGMEIMERSDKKERRERMEKVEKRGARVRPQNGRKQGVSVVEMMFLQLSLVMRPFMFPILNFFSHL